MHAINIIPQIFSTGPAPLVTAGRGSSGGISRKSTPDVCASQSGGSDVQWRGGPTHCHQMFTLWQKLYKEQLMTDISDVQLHHHANHDTHSIFNMSDKDTGMTDTSSHYVQQPALCVHMHHYA